MESTDQRAERWQNVVVPHESARAGDACDGLAAVIIEAQRARRTVDCLRFPVTQQRLMPLPSQQAWPKRSFKKSKPSWVIWRYQLRSNPTPLYSESEGTSILQSMAR